MGQQNAKQQRLDNAAKTGVFAIQDKQTMSFPEKALQIPSLRTLHIEVHLPTYPPPLPLCFPPSLPPSLEHS